MRPAGSCACGGGCPRCQNKTSVQAKLAVSQPGDIYEQEADRVADQILRMPASAVQRKCASCTGGGTTCPRCVAEKERGVRRKEAGAGLGSAPEGLLDGLSSGQPLDAAARDFFEPRFGYDFSSVRVHRDAKAAESAAAVSALAYTVGRDVVFGVGQYAPDTAAGRRLVGHELTHVVQQAGASKALSTPPGYMIQRYGHKKSCPQSFLESHIWLGTDLARKMVQHALNSLCAALYGNPTTRAKEARVQLKVIFGSDWKDKAQIIYNVYHRLLANLPGGFMYDCITGCNSEDKGDKETEWANAWVGGGSKGDVNVCYENLRMRGLKWFAHVVIHELGHLILSLEHGSDDVSGTCAQETDDAECYGLLAEELWRLVDPEYSKSNVDLCLSGANGRTQDPSNWD